ncbi:MAG: hypothetical protein Q4B36_05745 [Tissierellia bacterium]|nr:hypothetical protein [Tissierellia bacterium]
MENYDEKQYELEFTRPIIKYGRLINLLAIPLCFLPSLAMWLVFDTVPTAKEILTGWVLIASIYGIYAIIEPISYFPMVGLSGTYMSCLSGNISNVRIPCSIIVQDSLGVEPGTKKAEIVSTIGIAGSIITNIIVVTIAAIGGAALMAMFPPVVIEAFEYVSAAIFGAMFAMAALKDIRSGFISIVLAFILIKFGLPSYVIIPVIVFGMILLALLLNKGKK